MSLLDTQSAFMARLLSDDNDHLSPGEHVYHNAYRRRLVEALSETFERVWAWLGDDAFEAAAAAHIAQRPSTSWTLDLFGTDFDQTLVSLYPEDPEINELAWLDGALRRAFSGPDVAPLDGARLASVDWSRAVLVAVPTLQHHPLQTNAPALWAALSRNETPSAAQHLPQPAGIVVWRHGLEPFFRTLEADEYAAVKAVADGTRFADICAELETSLSGEEVTLKIGTWLSQWIGEGLICDVTEAR